LLVLVGLAPLVVGVLLAGFSLAFGAARRLWLVAFVGGNS